MEGLDDALRLLAVKALSAQSAATCRQARDGSGSNSRCAEHSRKAARFFVTRFALTIEFDGTPFVGLQRQARAERAAILEDAARITGEEGALQCAHRYRRPCAMRSHWIVKGHRALPPDGSFERAGPPRPHRGDPCEIVPDDWHARFSCTGRSYVYRIANRRAPLTLEKDRLWQVGTPLDHQAMHRAAQALVGLHDFTTFRSVHCQSDSPVKTLDRLDVQRDGEEVRIHAAARSFLHHQVRSMVGCLALVGMGRWPGTGAALAARTGRTGLNAPPHGLYFVEATYPEEGDHIMSTTGRQLFTTLDRTARSRSRSPKAFPRSHRQQVLVKMEAASINPPTSPSRLARRTRMRTIRAARRRQDARTVQFGRRHATGSGFRGNEGAAPRHG